MALIQTPVQIKYIAASVNNSLTIWQICRHTMIEHMNKGEMFEGKEK
jgi:hypothetical protein